MLRHVRWLAKLVYWPLKPLVRCKIIPDAVQESLELNPSQPVFYILRTESASDLATLKRVCQKIGLPDPMQPVQFGESRLSRVICLEKPHALWGERAPSDALQQGLALLQAQQRNPKLQAQLMPVSVLWGRAPGKENKEKSFTSVLGDSESPSWLAKLFIVLLSGRNTLVRFSRPVSLDQMISQTDVTEETAHKLLRVARVHFYRQRLAATGPKLPNRSALFEALLSSESIQQAIQEEAQSKNLTVEEAKAEALKLLNEIAADYRDSTVRFGDVVLTWLWKRLYNGIQVNNSHVLTELARKGHEIVYVPCHRSHMDYLLLSHVIYNEGLAPPHIAAGINLNFWPVGSLFRRGGAFFIRRSFSGNKLYSAVFREYLSQLFSKGHPVKYYTEGGRSRTGRLLQPKTGMLAMTVQTMLKGIERPISLVPVYLGYEHVMEVNTYLKELTGSTKEKESVFGVFNAIRKLRNYGYGFVNFGEPISLNQFISQQQPDWRDESQQEQKPDWMYPIVDRLASQLMRQVNQSAALNSINMHATVLLATRQHSLPRQELERQLAFYQQLHAHAPYSSLVTCAQGSAAQWIEHALKLEKVQQHKDSFGEIIQLSQEQAITMSYYRNNVSHVFIVPALLATALLQHRELSFVQLKNCIQLLQPLLQEELFLHIDDLDTYLKQLLQCMLNAHLVELSADQYSATSMQDAGYRMLELLACNAQDILQRYAVVLNLLARQPLTKEELEQKSQLLAKRLNTLHGVSSPEYLDKKLFSTLVTTLTQTGLCQLGDADTLSASAQSNALLQTINDLLNADVLQTLRQIVQPE